MRSFYFLRLQNSSIFKSFDSDAIKIRLFSSESEKCSSPDNYPNLPKPPVVKRIPKEYRTPVNWLPFQWHRRPKFNIWEQSGDTIKKLETDMFLPRPGFELSEELKKSDEQVQEIFSLRNASKADIKQVHSRELLKRIQRHPNDFTSLEAKIALKTIQVRSLFEHKAQMHKREAEVSRIALPIIIQKRNRLLKHLKFIDNERFVWICHELQLYFEPALAHVLPDRYCKKWELRKMTREYCEEMMAGNKAAYHEELRRQQEDFLKEKKEALAWIEEEKKIIAALNV